MSDLKILYDNQGISAGALGGRTVKAQAHQVIDGNTKQGFRVIKSRNWVEFRGKAASEGPLMYGIACALSDPEIEANIEEALEGHADPSIQGQGWIKPLAFIDNPRTDGVINNGAPFNTKVNWSVPEGDSISQWVYNLNASAITTGTVVGGFWEITGVWLRD